MTLSTLTDDELAALTALVRKAIVDDPYPYAPPPQGFNRYIGSQLRLATLKSALAKLDPASVPRPLPERKPAA